MDGQNLFFCKSNLMATEEELHFETPIRVILSAAILFTSMLLMICIV
jgi:hypothetical protein